jgi:hypothetical protein
MCWACVSVASTHSRCCYCYCCCCCRCRSRLLSIADVVACTHTDWTTLLLCIHCKQAQLDEKLDNIRGAVTMGYPQGLPPFDPVRLAIEGDKAGIQHSNAHILNLTYQRNSTTKQTRFKLHAL